MEKILKSLQVILLFFPICSSLFGQEFLVQGKQWVYQDIEHVGANYFQVHLDSITIEGDTIINGEKYEKLVLTDQMFCINEESVEYLREDGGKIYRFSPVLGRGLLMIDFSAEDTFAIEFEPSWTSQVPVDTAFAVIDSSGIITQYDGTEMPVKYLRILNNQSFDDDHQFLLYEDLGYLNGGVLFPALGTGLCDGGKSSVIHCLVTPEQEIHFTEYPCDSVPPSFVLDAVSEQRDAVDLGVYPNPGTGKVNIPAGATLLGAFDLRGRPAAFTQWDGEVEFLGAVQGMYFLQLVVAGGGVAVVRLVVL